MAVCSTAVRACLYGTVARRLKISWEEVNMVEADQSPIGNCKVTDVFELSGTIRVEFEIHVMRDGKIIHNTTRMLKCGKDITEQVKTLLGLGDLEVTCTCDGKDLENMTLETLIPSLSRRVAISLPRVIECTVTEPQSRLSNVSVEWSGRKTSQLLVLQKRDKLPTKAVYMTIKSLVQMGDLPISVFVCKQSDPSYQQNLGKFFRLSVTDDTEFRVTVSAVPVKFHTSTWQCTSYEILPVVTFGMIIKQMCRNRPEVQDRKVFSKFHKCFFDCDTVISSLDNLHRTEFFIVDIWHMDPSKLTKIGSGAYGSVYRYTGSQNESYAVKNLQEAFIWEQRRERREMEILLTTRHPCVLDFVGVDTPEGSCALVKGIVTELMDGSIDNGELRSPTEKSIALVGIALGMAYLHENHFIHRDLKPANVFFSRSKDDRLSSIKIGDFGSARDLESSITKSANPKMTIGFQAPETFDDGEMTSYASDVFSFACIYYWLLTDGQLLCTRARDIYGYVNAIKRGERPDARVAPSRKMQDLLTRCWDNRPEKRPTFEHILNELRQAKYMAFSDTNSKEVWNFVESVKERERDSET